MRRAVAAIVITNLTCVACTVILLLVCKGYFPSGQEAFVEESYVNFRYARNIAEGHGFVWNVGEQPVLGVTSLAWVFTLVEAGKTVKPTAQGEVTGVPTEMVVAPMVGIAHVTVAMFAATFAALLLVRTKYRWLVLLVPLHVALNPYFAWHSVSGLETSQAICFVSVLLLFSAMFLKRPGLLSITMVSVWGSLGCLVRPDMMVPVLALLVSLVVMGARGGRFRALAGSIVAFAAPAVVGVVLLALKSRLFGTALSPSFAITGSFLKNVLHPTGFAFGYVGGFLLLAAPYLLLMGFGAVVRARRMMGLEHAWLPAVGAHLLWFLPAVPENGFGYRFLIPMWMVIVVLSVVGLAEVMHFLKSNSEHRRRVLSMALTVGAILFLVGYPMHLVGNVRAESHEEHSTYDDLRELAGFMRDFKTGLKSMPTGLEGVVSPKSAEGTTSSAEDVLSMLEDQMDVEGDEDVAPRMPPEPPRELCLATTETGRLAYLSGWKTIDMVGMNDPDIVRHYRTVDLPAEFIMRPKPDLIFMPNRRHKHIDEAVSKHPYFKNYRPIGAWRIRLYQGAIMVKRGSPMLRHLVRFLKIRQRYLHDHPEDAVVGHAHKYVRAYRMTTEPKPGSGPGPP